MQTFLPYSSFVKSASALDNKRLTNQVNEAAVIYAALKGAKAWRWHPATRMWRTYEDALLLYRTACIGECIRRGIEREWRVLDGEVELFERLEICAAQRFRAEQPTMEPLCVAPGICLPVLSALEATYVEVPPGGSRESLEDLSCSPARGWYRAAK